MTTGVTFENKYGSTYRIPDLPGPAGNPQYDLFGTLTMGKPLHESILRS